jgi:hypothetical protein
VGAVRDHAISLACEGLPSMLAQNHDDLSSETLARFDVTLVGAIEPPVLWPLPSY